MTASGERSADPQARGKPQTAKPPTPSNVGEMRAMAAAFLERRGCEEARLEADLLVAHALGLDRLGLLMKLDAPLQLGEVDRARDLLVRRGRREPVAYITGTREFYGRAFEVGPGVLIPRPETELIVDLARSWCRAVGASDGELNERPLRILDLGTGSGCLAVTLGLELRAASVVAVDLSPEALAWAARNVTAWDLGERVSLLEGDGLALAQSQGPFDLVVSNPPYVAVASTPELSPEVRDYEPGLALFAPVQDPDYWLRELLALVPEILQPNGCLLVELGFDQGPRLASLAGTIPAICHRDLGGIERVVQAMRPGEDWPVDQPAAAST